MYRPVPAGVLGILCKCIGPVPAGVFGIFRSFRAVVEELSQSRNMQPREVSPAMSTAGSSKPRWASCFLTVQCFVSGSTCRARFVYGRGEALKMSIEIKIIHACREGSGGKGGGAGLQAPKLAECFLSFGQCHPVHASDSASPRARKRLVWQHDSIDRWAYRNCFALDGNTNVHTDTKLRLWTLA